MNKIITIDHGDVKFTFTYDNTPSMYGAGGYAEEVMEYDAYMKAVSITAEAIDRYPTLDSQILIQVIKYQLLAITIAEAVEDTDAIKVTVTT